MAMLAPVRDCCLNWARPPRLWRVASEFCQASTCAMRASMMPPVMGAMPMSRPSTISSDSHRCRPALTGRQRWESLLMVDGLDIGMAPITGGIIDARMAQVDAWQNSLATLHSLGGLAQFRQQSRTGANMAM